MPKEGDRVRFLNATGGGVISRIEGKTAYVEDEDGFESPVLLKDIVVVLPAGHESKVKGSSIMFDQKAFDAGKNEPQTPVKKEEPKNIVPEPEPPAEETPHGDNPTIILAFEPENLKKLPNTGFTGVLVNDSNYYLDFVFLKRDVADREWEILYRGTVNPNELIDVAVLKPEELPEYGKIVFQAIAYKKDKSFSVIPPMNVSRKLDLTKFHKLHCFTTSRYFDTPVLEFPLYPNKGTL